MYGWVNKHLKLGLPEPIVEQDFKPLSIAEMSVWNASHPKPVAGDAYERSLVKWITEDNQRQMQALIPKDADSLAKYRRVVGGAVDVLIGRGLPEAGAITAKSCKGVPSRERIVLIRNQATGEELPALMLFPEKWEKREVVVWVSRGGKDAAWQSATVAKLRVLNSGMALIAVDLYGQGEFTKDGKPLARQRLNSSGHDDWAQYAGYTFGYNYPLFAQRVHDILSAVSFARDRLHGERVYLVGLGGAGHWVLAARAQAGAAIDKAVADTAGLRFGRVSSIADPDFLPGGAKYLDLPGMAALSAPHPLWIAGEGREAPAVVTAAYRAAGKPEALTMFDGGAAKSEAAAVEWLLH
jgi:hypothetical protein